MLWVGIPVEIKSSIVATARHVFCDVMIRVTLYIGLMISSKPTCFLRSLACLMRSCNYIAPSRAKPQLNLLTPIRSVFPYTLNLTHTHLELTGGRRCLSASSLTWVDDNLNPKQLMIGWNRWAMSVKVQKMIYVWVWKDLWSHLRLTGRISVWIQSTFQLGEELVNSFWWQIPNFPLGWLEVQGKRWTSKRKRFKGFLVKVRLCSLFVSAKLVSWIFVC